MVGKNIGLWLEEGPQALPKTVSEFGSHPEEIFITYEHFVAKYGRKELEKLPLGAVGLYTFLDKIKVGLQQLMAGTRNYRLSTLSRGDLIALTEEAARISGIPYVMDAFREEAERIIDE